MANQLDYTRSHLSAEVAGRYLTAYESGFYGAFFAKIEAPLLRSIVGGLDLPSSRALDLACGQGRIAGIIDEFAGEVIGVDVSEEMLRLARGALPHLRFLRRDLRDVSDLNCVGLVTGFRLFLNADEQLRVAAARSMFEVLLPGGFALANTHLLPRSPTAVGSAAVRWALSRPHSVLSLAELAGLLEDAGFEVISVIPYGVLPRTGPIYTPLHARLMLPAEGLLLGRLAKLPKALCHHGLVVARRPVEAELH